MTKKKKSDKKRRSPCPANCTKIKLKMDCSSHPPGLPFPDRQRPNGWPVSTKARCGRMDTRQMRDEFSIAYKDKDIPSDIRNWAQTRYGISANRGKELIDSMIEGGLNPEMHHKLPVMLNGTDTADNFIPIPRDDHQKSSGGVHQWWDTKLRELERSLEGRLGRCDKKSKNKKERELHNCARTKRGFMRKTCESQLTKISGCLKNQGIDLYVDCGI